MRWPLKARLGRHERIGSAEHGPHQPDFTALTNRMPTADLAPITQPGTEFFGYHTVAGGRTIIFAGGMPLERNGILVGAVGVSGGDAGQDQQAVEAGVRAFAGS